MRDAGPQDLETVLELAGFLDSYNLPRDKTALLKILTASEASFRGAGLPAAERRYLFMMEDRARGGVVGTSMLIAQQGSPESPHIYFDLNTERANRSLTLGTSEEGPTEVAGLIVRPEYRRHPERLGIQVLPVT